jgi:hypothetical protein
MKSAKDVIAEDIVERLRDDAQYIDNYDGFVGSAGRTLRAVR